MENLDAKRLARLGELLWAYRRATDRLEFCLEVELRFSAAGDDRWANQVTDLVEEVAERIGLLDLERNVLLGDNNLRLADIIATCPEPWGSILVDHGNELQGAADRVQQLITRNEIALEERRGALERLTDMIAPATSTSIYDRKGQVRSSKERNALLFDGRA